MQALESNLLGAIKDNLLKRLKLALFGCTPLFSREARASEIPLFYAS